LFNILRGWAKLIFGGVSGRGGQEILWPRISKDAKMHFSRLMAKPLVAKALKKKFQVAEVGLPLRRPYTGVVHLYKHTFQTLCGAVHHSLKGLCSVREPKWREHILKLAKMV
jgi:hypothetical protein